MEVQPDAEALREPTGRAADGELTVRVAEVLPLQGFRDRYERLARGGLREKIVLTP